MWDDYGFATGGQLATDATTRAGINGLVKDGFTDPTTGSGRVAIVAPWDNSTTSPATPETRYVVVSGQDKGLLLRYIVFGEVPTGGAVKFDITPDGGSPTTITAPINDNLIGNLVYGEYTIRGYIVDSNDDEVGGSSSGAIPFEILQTPPAATPVTLDPIVADGDANLNNRVTKAISVKQLLGAVWGEAYLLHGVALTAATGVQCKWQFTDGSDPWADLPTNLDDEHAFVLPSSAKLRFVVEEDYEYSSSDSEPTLEFHRWYGGGSGLEYTQVDIGSISNDEFFDDDVFEVVQPLLEP